MLDLYNTITERIINALEQGTIPWKKPWSGGTGCISYVSGKPYSLLNHILLGGISGEYITFNQCAHLGGHVRKGEKSKTVVFWKPFEVTDPDTGEVETHFYLRHYSVFHLDQCEGIKPRWNISHSDLKPDEKAEGIIQDYVARSDVRFISTESSQAFYRPATDEVVVPCISQYQELAEYYSTAMHELTHSTGHSSRLNRLADTASFGSQDYSKEELVAELGSAFLVNHCGLETKGSFDNSAAYIQGWLKALKDDKRLLVSAAGAAEKAVDLILGKEGECCSSNSVRVGSSQ